LCANYIQFHLGAKKNFPKIFLKNRLWKYRPDINENWIMFLFEIAPEEKTMHQIWKLYAPICHYPIPYQFLDFNKISFLLQRVSIPKDNSIYYFSKKLIQIFQLRTA